MIGKAEVATEAFSEWNKGQVILDRDEPTNWNEERVQNRKSHLFLFSTKRLNKFGGPKYA